MINVSEILYNLTEDKNVYNKDYDLIESGLLDSFAFIALLGELEDIGIVIQPTRVPLERFKTVNEIEKLIEETKKNSNLG